MPLRRISDRLVQHLFLVALPAVSHAGFQLIFTAMLRRHMGTTTTVSQVGGALAGEDWALSAAPNCAPHGQHHCRCRAFGWRLMGKGACAWDACVHEAGRLQSSTPTYPHSWTPCLALRNRVLLDSTAREFYSA